jgi:DNA-binding NtrC family response regulator
MTVVAENEKAFLASALQRVIGSLKAQSGSLFLYDQELNELVLTAYHNSRGFVLTDVKKRVGEGVSGAVVKIRKPILVENIDTDPQFDKNGFTHYTGKSFISIPLLSGDSLAGLINITDKTNGGVFTHDDLSFADSELRVLLKQWLEQRAKTPKMDPDSDRQTVSPSKPFLNMTGKHPKMQKIFTMIEAVADTRATVLINGESGTGKRLIAHAIHNCNPVERIKPFVEVSCGALTETLLESELFGHVKGAFTGAHKDRAGRFELANNGTIFLDEIDTFSPAMQVKLLRVLQDGEFERVGDSKTIKIDIRVIAATNQDLTELIAQGKFRKDLYYRLNIINIEVPPLRDRVSDIDLLVKDLIRKHARQLNRTVRTAADDVLRRLREYHWPGNIRELENVVERAVILSKGPVVTFDDLPDHLVTSFFPSKIEEAISRSSARENRSKAGREKTAGDAAGDNGGSSSGHGTNGYSHPAGVKLRSALKDSEQELIGQALAAANGSRTQAARNLGINRTTLYKKMIGYGMLKSQRRNGRKAQ